MPGYSRKFVWSLYNFLESWVQELPALDTRHQSTSTRLSILVSDLPCSICPARSSRRKTFSKPLGRASHCQTAFTHNCKVSYESSQVQSNYSSSSPSMPLLLPSVPEYLSSLGLTPECCQKCCTRHLYSQKMAISAALLFNRPLLSRPWAFFEFHLRSLSVCRQILI